MLLIIVIVILGTLFEIVTPLLSGKILDEVIRQSTNQTKEFSKLFTLLALSLSSIIIYLALRSLGQRLGDHLSGKIRKFLTEIFYDKALKISQSYYDSEISGKLVNQLNRGIASIQEFANASTNFIIPTFLQSFIVIGILMYFNLYLGILMISILPIYLWITSISTKRWGLKEEGKNKIEDLTRGRIQEVISNIKLVKGFTSEKREFKLLSTNLDQINAIYKQQSTEFHLFDFLRELILNVILFGTALIIYNNTLNGLITVGSVIVLIQLVDRARSSLFGMSYILGQIQAIDSGSKEFFEVLNIETTEDYNKKQKFEKIKNPKIEFQDVTFQYDSNKTVLENVSFDLSKNEMVALVGPSGAGKSTIVNLLLKFYNPTSGAITFNGKKYSKLSHNQVRNNIALVFQENELFSLSIKENVAYGSDIDDKKVISSLKKANAWEFVSNLEKGIDT